MVAADRNLEAAPVIHRHDFPCRIVGPVCDSLQSTLFKQVPQIYDGPKTFSQKDVRRSLDGWERLPPQLEVAPRSGTVFGGG